MRTFLLNMALTGALTLSSGALAAPYLGAGPIEAARAIGMDSSAVLVQKRSVNRSLRVRPRIGSRFKRRPYLNNPSRSARPSRVIRSRSGSGVLRDRYNRDVRSRSGSGSSGGGRRDIGAGQAVISAQSIVPGTVLGVRRNGSVYNVKILDRNRVRIISVNAATGQVMR